jgi:protein-S-isoprenylcysteine O-methyltransferase Ste14
LRCALSLLESAAAAAILHLLVIGYEEPRLRAQFGEQYEAYRRTVSRWFPRPPRASSAEAL